MVGCVFLGFTWFELLLCSFSKDATLGKYQVALLRPGVFIPSFLCTVRYVGFNNNMLISVTIYVYIACLCNKMK